MKNLSLIIGNKNYSSWSMRAWLLMKFLDLDFEEIPINLYESDSRERVNSVGGQTGLVPVLQHNELVIWDTMAITEYLYETYGKIWPDDVSQRARARSICNEIHSGLLYLREAMPLNTRRRNLKADITKAVEQDILRVVQIWQDNLNHFGGPWLFGEFSAADIFYAPVATRFQTYGITLADTAAAYQKKVLTHSLVAEWLALGAAEEQIIEAFE